MNADTRLADLLVEWEERVDKGEKVNVEELCKDCPELIDELRRRIQALQEMEWMGKREPTPEQLPEYSATVKTLLAVNNALQWIINPISQLQRLMAGKKVAPPASPPPSPRTSLGLEPGIEPIPGYRLQGFLGEGGYGEVWKATGPGGIGVAMKFIPLSKKAGKAELRALDVMKNIRHPHLVALFASWQVRHHLVIAMELAEGTLAHRLEQARLAGGVGIPREELWEYCHEAAKGLDYLNSPRPELHGDLSQGIQHRDVKPQNLLLVGGSVKVADFGLVRILTHSVNKHTGNMTLSYAAPEFFKGQTATRSDQYSLAVTYCELCGGRLPLSGDTPHEMMHAHLERVPDLGMLPEEERPVVQRALAKDPKDRWPSCRAFAEALRAR